MLPKRLSAKTMLWVPILGAFLLSVVAFVAIYQLDPFRFGDQPPLSAVPALVIAVLVLLIGWVVSATQTLQEASGYSDKIYEAVRTYLHITPAGSPEQAFKYICDRIPVLREVRNTSFNLIGEIDRANERLYETDIYMEAPELIAEYCSKRLIWKDIGDPVGVERLRSIRACCGAAAKGNKSNYHFKLIAHHEPQINFILLEFVDGAREVLFNWDFRGMGQDPKVLLSRDTNIVEMFSIHWNLLWSRASEDHDSHATRSTSRK